MMSVEQQRESAANESHTSQQRYNDSLPKYNTGQRRRNCAFRVKDRLMDGERKKKEREKDSNEALQTAEGQSQLERNS